MIQYYVANAASTMSGQQSYLGLRRPPGESDIFSVTEDVDLTDSLGDLHSIPVARFSPANWRDYSWDWVV